MLSPLRSPRRSSLLAFVVVWLAPALAAAEYDDVTQHVLRQARDRGLAHSRAWQTLLHYRPTFFGGVRSDVDGLDFFLTRHRGRTDPQAELDATLVGILAAPEPGVEHVQCRFPARHHWLRDALGLDPVLVPEQPCPELERWRAALSADSVALVYATAYINSPASMYGHTLLRLTRSTAGGQHLLDYAVSFAADVDTSNGLVYAAKGLTGGFPGRFYVMPFYMKVQEYSNVESRDLWEYRLALTPAQVRRLIEHTWEMRATHFDYFFFTENCSYQLLALLEAAMPELHLLDGFHLRVIPSDTVRVLLQQPGLLRERVGRPSLAATMLARRAVLRGEEIGAVSALVRADEDAATAALSRVPPARRVLVLDTAFEYLHYRHGYSDRPKAAYADREQFLLLARGRLGVPSPPLEIAAGVGAPEAGHGTQRLALGGGVAARASYRPDGSYETLSWRGAVHDYLDQPDGYPPESVLEMGHVRLRFENERRRLIPDLVTVVNVVSAPPFDRWMRKPAWGVWFGWDNARELPCEGWRCGYFGARTAFGIATSAGSPARSLLLLTVGLDAATGPAFADADYYRLGGGARGSLVLGLVPGRWRVLLEGRWDYYPLGRRGQVLRASLAQSLRLSRHLELRAAASVDGDYRQAGGELAAYF